jgi:hypothetical protein
VPRAANPKPVAVAAFISSGNALNLSRNVLTAVWYFSICLIWARTAAAFIKSCLTRMPPMISPLMTST